MAAKQAMKEKLQCTSKYGHLRISQDICHVRMTDIEGFLTIYGHSDNLLNNNTEYLKYSIYMDCETRVTTGLILVMVFVRCYSKTIL